MRKNQKFFNFIFFYGQVYSENIVNSNVELKLGKFLRMGKDRTKKLEVIR